MALKCWRKLGFQDFTVIPYVLVKINIF